MLQSGCVNVTVGAAGIGCGLITTADEDTEVHRVIPSVTVKEDVPIGTPVTVVVVPVPVVVVPPGVLVIVQVPVAGNPLSKTLPVAVKQSVCVILPINGAAGEVFTVRLTAFDVALLEPVQFVT